MIVVDTSAILAVFFDEPDKRSYQSVIASADRCLMSAVNLHETATVLRSRQGGPAVVRLWRFLDENGIQVVAFDEPQVRAAADAFDRFGKGIHARARLNICDCAAYALAKTREVPLLFKGDDFAHTDVTPAV